MTDHTYYLNQDGQVGGPFTAEFIRQQKLSGTTLVRSADSMDWVPVQTVSELQQSVEQMPIQVETTSVNITGQKFLFGGLTKDLTVAALGGMGSIALSFVDHIIPIGRVIVLLFILGQFAYFWGLLQLGRYVQLQRVQIGAWLLIVANLTDTIAFYSTGSLTSVCDWLTTVLVALGSVLAFVDLWGLRRQLDTWLISTVVLGNLLEVFAFHWQFTSQEWFQLLEALNVGLVAWLFYELIARQQPDRTSDSPVSSSLQLD